MTFSKEQWEVIEKQLSTPYGRVQLKCDGYEIVAKVEPYKALKWCVAVYVDGVIKGEWLDEKNERSRKFYCKNTRHHYSAKMRAESKEILKKRRLDKWGKEFNQEILDAKSEFWLPFWNSPKMFCRHLRKTCTDIKLMD